MQRNLGQTDDNTMRVSITALLLAAASVASADDFSYDYFNVGYGVIEFDDFDVDGDAIGIDGAIALADNFHLFAGYAMGDFDFDVESTSYNLGLGYNTPLSDTVDFVGRLSYEYIEVDAPLVPSVDDNGIGLGAGLRFAPNDQFELDGGLKYVELSDSGNDTGLSAGALYNFSDVFSMSLRGDWTDDVSSYTLGGRFYFGL